MNRGGGRSPGHWYEAEMWGRGWRGRRRRVAVPYELIERALSGNVVHQDRHFGPAKVPVRRRRRADRKYNTSARARVSTREAGRGHPKPNKWVEAGGTRGSNVHPFPERAKRGHVCTVLPPLQRGTAITCSPLIEVHRKAGMPWAMRAGRRADKSTRRTWASGRGTSPAPQCPRSCICFQKRERKH